jgi:hypothetical protein
VTLVLFQSAEFKTIKVWYQRMESIVANGLMVVRRPLRREEPHQNGDLQKSQK